MTSSKYCISSYKAYSCKLLRLFGGKTVMKKTVNNTNALVW